MPNSNKEEYKKYMNAYMKERWEKRRKEAIKFLGGQCSKCGSKRNLEFDHKKRSTKKFTMAKCSSFSEKRFKEELVKCQLLCKKCHLSKSKIDGSFTDNIYKKIVCKCGKEFDSSKAYAGHKSWCKE